VTVFIKTLIASAVVFSATAFAQDNKVLNLYSSRHYQTDEALYSNFTRQTGIRINRIEAGEDPLIERIRNEGERSRTACGSASPCARA
jgi:iron(III) transport system substrate-binding protein